MKLQINMRLMIMRRSLGLYSKGLIATGEQDQELGPCFTASGLGGTVTRKSRTKQNSNSKESDGY